MGSGRPQDSGDMGGEGAGGPAVSWTTLGDEERPGPAGTVVASIGWRAPTKVSYSRTCRLWLAALLLVRRRSQLEPGEGTE